MHVHYVDPSMDETFRASVTNIRSLAGMRSQVDSQNALAVERLATVRTHKVSRLRVDVHVSLQRIPVTI